MSVKSMEYWIFIQMILEVGLFAVVAVSLLKIRSWYRNIMAMQEERPTREEMAKMAQMGEVLEERRKNLEETLARLEQKAAAFQKQLSRGESWSPAAPASMSSWESSTSLRSQVEDLHRQGCSTEEIARRLQLNLAEVKMALDLSRARPR